jgi:hypothetical protein
MEYAATATRPEVGFCRALVRIDQGRMLPVQIFACLQLLDFITTLAGFRAGAAEASPFIAKLMHISSPVLGVAASKILALAFGGICVFTNRARLIGWINWWFAGLIVWNLLIILVEVKRH